jgi:hypothetical protein
LGDFAYEVVNSLLCLGAHLTDTRNLVDKDGMDPSGAQFRKPVARGAAIIISIIVVVLCLMMEFEYGGWLSIAMAVPYLAFSIAHIFVHWKASRNLSRRIVSLMAASHCLMLAAFLLQWDIGDNERGWLSLTALLGNRSTSDSPAPQWWPQGLAMNCIVFIPTAVLLVVLYRVSRPQIQE